MAEFTVKLCAAILPKLTAVAPVRLLPVITTDTPLPPDGGEKELIVGVEVEAEPKVKLDVELADPLGVVTLITPLAPLPTTAVIWVAEFTTKLWAAVPPNLTAVAIIRFVPVITTEVPVSPAVGEKELIVGTEVDAEPKVKL